MPTYCYEDESGVIHERVFSMGEAPEEILVASGVARRVVLRSVFTPRLRRL